MGPRIVLYTGKGGVGKTSVAAATARRAAAAGLRTVVLSTDPAHSLADVLGVPLGPDPSEVGPGLWAHQVDAQAELERHWAGVQEWVGGLLARRGVGRIAAAQPTVPPGADELFGLLQLRRHADSGAFDLVVVDCAPTGETLRLLSLPDVARWWLSRVVGAPARVLDAARPFARAMLDVALPGETALEEVAGLLRELMALSELLRDGERVSVRLVMTPERVVADQARRTFTYLHLYGLPTDAVVVNRVLPAEAGAYFAPWRDRQQAELRTVDEAFAPVPVLRAPWLEEEVRGAALLDRLGDALFAGLDAAGVLHEQAAEQLELDADGARLRLALPFARKEDVAVQKVGHELVVRVDGRKRTLMLPPAVGEYRPTGAAFADGVLTVTFDGPDPARAERHDRASA